MSLANERWYGLSPADIKRSFSGSIHVEVGEETVTPRHFTKWVSDRVGSAAFTTVSGAAGGSRLRLSTAASRIRLTMSLERFGYGEDVPEAAFIAVDSAVQWSPGIADQSDGVFLSADASDSVTKRPGPQTVIELVRPAASNSHAVDIYPTPNASVTLLGVETNAPVAPRHEPPAIRWLHHGSSISQGGHLVNPRLAWPVRAADQLGVEVLNASLPGNSLLDPCVGEELAGVDADIVSLELGINVVNWDSHIERTFVPALHGFLDHFTRNDPTRRVVLISPFSCEIFEHHGGPIEIYETGLFAPSPTPRPGALTLSRVRELMQDVVTSRALGSILFMDGRTLFGPSDEAMLEDRLHPNAEGTRLIADRFVAAVRKPGSDLAAHFAGATSNERPRPLSPDPWKNGQQ